jgi:hypothetical protein
VAAGLTGVATFAHAATSDITGLTIQPTSDITDVGNCVAYTVTATGSSNAANTGTITVRLTPQSNQAANFCTGTVHNGMSGGTQTVQAPTYITGGGHPSTGAGQVSQATFATATGQVTFAVQSGPVGTGAAGNGLPTTQTETGAINVLAYADGTGTISPIPASRRLRRLRMWSQSRTLQRAPTPTTR